MGWKACGLFFCVCIALLSVVTVLWQKNSILEEQNCTLKNVSESLKKQMEVGLEEAKKKAERDKEELERLAREIAVMSRADPAWSDSPIPSVIAMQLHRLIKEHNSTFSASEAAENSL